MKRIIFISIILLYSYSFAQVFSGSTAGQCLKIEAGAKAIGMGGAFVSLANDASALYWNPAGIGRLSQNQATFSHTYWLAETSHDFVGVVIKVGNQHAFGLSYNSLTMPDMKVRTEIYPDGTGEFFSSSDYALGLSYALNITDQFTIGFTGKYVGQSIWHMKASTFAFDVGTLYETPIKGLNLGMSVSNISSKMMYEGKDVFVNYDYDPNQSGGNDKIFADLKMDQWDLPLFFRFGVSMKFSAAEDHNFIFSADANHPNDYGESINTGIEYGFRERVFLRVGYKSLFKNESEEGLTSGLGLVYYITEFLPVYADYSFADFGRLKDVHRLTLGIGF